MSAVFTTEAVGGERTAPAQITARSARRSKSLSARAFYSFLHRIISPDQRKRLEHQFPERFTWRDNFWQARMTAWHYTVRKCKILRWLRTMQKRHSPTPQILSPTQHTQVIYVLYHIRNPRRLYVGQTRRTAFRRFTEHVRDARRIFARGEESTDILHRYMARVGWQDFRIFPIEHISYTPQDEGTPGIHEFPDTRTGRQEFRTRAAVREVFWKRILHAFMPRGLCLEGKRENHKKSRKGQHSLQRTQNALSEHDPLTLTRIRSSVSLERKLSFLFTHITSDRFTPASLQTHAFRNIKRMYLYLHSTTAAHWQVTQTQYDTLADSLFSFLPVTQTVENITPLQTAIVQLFVHSDIESLGINKVVSNRDLWHEHIPPEVRVYLRRPLLAYKYDEPIWRKICNYTDVAKLSQQEVQNILDTPCQCQSPSFDRFRDPHHGHVLTTDPAIMGNDTLRELMARGTMFRSKPHDTPQNKATDIHFVFEDLSRALEVWRKWVLSTLQRYSHDENCLNKWIQAVQERAWAQAPPSLGHSPEPRFHPQQEAKAKLRWLQRHMVFTTVDKASNNFCVVCKKHYLQQCLTELEQGQAYTPTERTAHELLDDGQQTCNEMRVGPQQDAQVPAFHCRVKLHKNPISLRFIAGSARAPLTPLSKRLTEIFKALMPEIESRWERLIQSFCTDTSRTYPSWIITSSDSVPRICRSFTRSRPYRDPVTLATYDFTSMYTTLSIADIRTRIGSLVHKIFDHRLRAYRMRYLDISGDTPRWLSSLPVNADDAARLPMIYTADQIVSMLCALVDSTYVQFAGRIWRQHVGIPMGTNCAGFIANLLCFTYEYDYMRQLIRTGDTVTAEMFLHTCRYIDDLFTIGVTGRDPQVIYPQESLTLNLADSGTAVPYMDMLIRQNRRRGLITSIYDKRLDPQYRDVGVIRYPDVESYLTPKAKFGIVTGQLHRFARLCTLPSDFVYNIALMFYRMIQKGYPDNWLWRPLRRFLDARTLYGGKPTGFFIRRVRFKLRQIQDGSILPGPRGQVPA